jgi:hypothetical protein
LHESGALEEIAKPASHAGTQLEPDAKLLHALPAFMLGNETEQGAGLHPPMTCDPLVTGLPT